jgi:hypothetical protein
MNHTCTRSVSQRIAHPVGRRAVLRPAAALARLLAVCLVAGAAGAEDAAPTDGGPVGSGDWYCVGYDAGHSYTSPDTVTTPLKFKWCWQPPAEEHVELLHIVSSGGKVFAHGRHMNTTPVGTRNGAHNWSIDLETGKEAKEDPAGTSPNDEVLGYSVGSYGGELYQADDGGPPYGYADVWSPVQISATEQYWAVVNVMHIDGAQPGILCAKTGQGVGSAWQLCTNVAKMATGCAGDVSIAGGKLFATTSWKTAGPQFENGLGCYELAGGHRDWTLDGHFVGVSACADWCVAVDERRVMVAVGAKDGKVLAQIGINALPACPPMLTDKFIALYDDGGGFTTFQLNEKNGKYSFKTIEHADFGRFSGPAVVGRYNCPFCRSADGTMFVASGASVSAIPASKKAKRWSYTLPPDAIKAIAPFGQPIIAHGMLLVVAKGGVVCFDAKGAPQGAAGGAHGGHN